MKIKFYILVILFSFFSLSLFADEMVPASGWYVRLDAGLSSALDPDLTIPDGPIPADLGSSPVFGGGLGLAYVSGLRADLTFTYRSGFEQISGFAAMRTGQAEFKSLLSLLSLYLDLYSTPRVSPYAGFGIGFSRNELGRITITNPDGSLLGTIEGERKTNFAYQLCGGAAIQVSNRILLDLGYRFVKAGEYESADLLIFPDGSAVSGKDLGKFSSHEFVVSFQYTF